MTKKLFKILLILTLVLSFYITFSFATDINLNLPGTDPTQTSNDQPINNPDANSEINNSVDNNGVNGDDTTNDTNIVDDNTQAPVDNPLGEGGDVSTAPSDIQTVQPTTTTSSDSGLSATNIINILLITVGVILILLAIAIIIKLR